MCTLLTHTTRPERVNAFHTDTQKKIKKRCVKFTLTSIYSVNSTQHTKKKIKKKCVKKALTCIYSVNSTTHGKTKAVFIFFIIITMDEFKKEIQMLDIPSDKKRNIIESTRLFETLNQCQSKNPEVSTRLYEVLKKIA